MRRPASLATCRARAAVSAALAAALLVASWDLRQARRLGEQELASQLRVFATLQHREPCACAPRHLSRPPRSLLAGAIPPLPATPSARRRGQRGLEGGGCRGASTATRRPALASLSLGPALLAGLLVLLLAVIERFGRTEPILEFICQNTDIQVVDEPIDRAPFQAPNGFFVKDGSGVRWYMKSEDVLRRALADGAIGFGETYVDGDWQTNDVEGLCHELLRLEGKELQLGWRAAPLLGTILLGKLRSQFLPNNTLGSARSNVQLHYDLDAWEISQAAWVKLYEQMLGPTMQYTCAFFARPDMSLDEAQRAKMALVADKLDLKPGMRLLDIGCGFGGMAYYLATEFGVHVTGVTLSKNQAAYAREHFAHPNVEIILQDYRATEGTFDRVYSIGMFEQVGRRNTAEYFDKCYELLKDDGIMLLHTIGVNQSKVSTGKSFIGTHVFPGCELPHFCHFSEVSEAGKWHVEDWHSFGKSYARTLRSWRHNVGDWSGFEEFDDRFRRMWEYWQLSSASSFDRRRTTLWQIVYTKANSSRPDDCHHVRTRPELLSASFPEKLLRRQDA